MSKQEITLKDLRINASGDFLTEELPGNYDEMSENEFDQFLINHAWEPFENDTANDIWDNIDNSAHSLKRFLEDKGITVS